MVKKLIAVGIAAAPFALLATPAQAQNAPVNGVLTVYGEDPCPRDQICVRAPESERFRIPKDLRDQQIKPQNQSQAVRLAPVVEANTTGTGSCSTVGPGGGTGCFGQAARAAKEERKQREAAERNLPLP
ncbi:MAG: hypothetical protein ACOY45_05355 [Pseudomonadota bacterium]